MILKRNDSDRLETELNDFLHIDEGRVEVRWINKDLTQNPCLIFLHEGLGCVEMWKDFPKTLSDKVRCPALVFSRLGYGKSAPCPLPWKLNFMHREALKVLPKVIVAAGIRDYILVGHSDGGSIAVIYAGGFPRISGLKGMITLAAHVFCEQLSVDSIAYAKVMYETGSLKQGLEKYHGKNTENAFRGWNDVWLNPKFMKWNIEKYLPKISVPMLAIQGKDDQYGTPAQIDSIQKNVSKVKTLLLDDCRHAPHFEQSEPTLSAVTEFIETII